jgi:hypothetical protein
MTKLPTISFDNMPGRIDGPFGGDKILAKMTKFDLDGSVKSLTDFEAV